ncbi:MmpS family transport accessory protein [Amycolatopsis sp. NPDC051903]|uniref:MmpS family transport accessory protein n=1 Tax=Amycolatopsis sp. NPDC051903 TaxID=3363936 RepID=UPI003790F60C
MPPAPKNGLGTAGFVLGLIGLIFSFIPIIGLIAWPLVILGIIFAAVGLGRIRKHRATNKGLTITGLVLSVIGLIICIVWAATTTKAVNDLNTEAANRSVTVHYEVTGSAKDATITYSTMSGSDLSTNQEQTTLPWSKDVTAQGLVKGGTLTVTTGADGGNATCKVVVDGTESKTATANGQFATASCDGF